MMAADRIIRWTTAAAVIGVAAVAAVASHEHAYALVRAHGESGWTGRLVPLTVDGLISNVAHGLGHGLIGAAVAAWPAVALVGSYELLMVIVRSAQVPAGAAVVSGARDGALDDDPLQAQAAEAFAGEVAAGRVPSVRAIRARLDVGQPRAQRVRAYLTALVNA